jgi:hypothetical protein
MRHPNKVLALLLAGSAAAFAQPADTPPAAPPAAAPKPPAAPRVTTVTPVGERVLVIGALAKRTGETRFLTLKPGQYIDFAGIRITARTCETTPPWEWPKLQGAFLQVDERLAGHVRRVFSGWLYAESPSLNVMEHPRYDVWLKSCTMRFPDGPKPADTPASPPASTAKMSAASAAASESKPR